LYKVEIKKSARKQLEEIPLTHRQIIANKINELANEPIQKDAIPLSGYKNIYRIRYSFYRIVYQVEKDVLLVEVIRIAHRKDVYRKLDF
jgi:mRNA interferase RelE/StbE